MREGKGDEEETIQSQSPTEEIEMIDYPHIQNDKQPAWRRTCLEFETQI